jgi:putative transposase
MSVHRPKYKTVRHYHEPGDCHELTISCYHRLPLLTNDTWRRRLSQSIDDAMRACSFRLVAFIYMLEHVHLLVYPTTAEPEIDALLAAIKRPYSAAIKKLLVEAKSPLLKKLTVRERPGRTVFRYWQEGPGYDRNLSTEEAVLAAIDYIHLIPVRRGLCSRVADWKWSSGRKYLDWEGPRDLDLPVVHGLPAEFFGGGL